MEATETELQKTDEFERNTLSGFMNVLTLAPEGSDAIAPSRIIDLKVTGASWDDKKITLEWTAMGDNFDEGTGECNG